jgi:hypothetical protein
MSLMIGGWFSGSGSVDAGDGCSDGVVTGIQPGTIIMDRRTADNKATVTENLYIYRILFQVNEI